MKLKKLFIEGEKERSNLFWLIFLAAIVGFGGSFAGIILIKPYLASDLYSNLPVNKEVDLSQDNLRQVNLIIENAKKIIINQEKKVDETVTSGQNSLVGVFKKKELLATKAESSLDKRFDLTDYYKLDEEVGEGLVVTSDGWILTTDFTKNAAENLIIKNYVVITKSKDIYLIDKVVKTGIDSYLFIHLSGAKDLSVKSFANKLDLSASQSLVALNWRGESYLTSIVNRKEKTREVKDSDGIIENITLSDDLGNYFENAFIFTLSSEVVGFFDKKTGPIPLSNFQPLIKGLLEKKDKKLPALGVSYVNLENFAIKNPGYEKGALLYPNNKLPAVKDGSAAKEAQFKEGDIILSVDNVTVDTSHDLADIIQTYSAGDQINIIYRRNGQENAIKVKLGELK
jgi:hypothetical protein